MDWRLAFRSLRRSPGFTSLAVLILALGIGVNSAMFSVVQCVILRPLAFHDSHRLISITSTWKSSKYGQESDPDFLDLRSSSTVFESMAAYDSGIENVIVNSAGEFTGAASVSQDFLGPLLYSRWAGASLPLRIGGAKQQTLLLPAKALEIATSEPLIKSFIAMTSVNLGFHPEGMLVAQIAVPGAPQHAVDTFFKPLLARLQTVPDVRSAALALGVPGSSGFNSNGSFIVSGQSMKDFTVSAPQANFSVVSPEFFAAFQIPLVSGRALSVHADAAVPPVAIVGESLARSYFPHGQAIGQNLLCGYDSVSMKWMTIVGVVRDTYLDGPTTSLSPSIFMPYSQHPQANQFVFVKPTGNPLRFAAILRDTIRKLDGAASVKLSTTEDHLPPLFLHHGSAAFCSPFLPVSQ